MDLLLAVDPYQQANSSISLVNINPTPLGSSWIRICTASLAKVLLLISGLDYSVIELTKDVFHIFRSSCNTQENVWSHTFTTGIIFRYITFTLKFKSMLSVLNCSIWFLFSHASKIIRVTGKIIKFEGDYVLILYDFKISCHIIKYIFLI
jgi:hypothetical protein